MRQRSALGRMASTQRSCVRCWWFGAFEGLRRVVFDDTGDRLELGFGHLALRFRWTGWLTSAADRHRGLTIRRVVGPFLFGKMDESVGGRSLGWLRTWIPARRGSSLKGFTIRRSHQLAYLHSRFRSRTQWSRKDWCFLVRQSTEFPRSSQPIHIGMLISTINRSISEWVIAIVRPMPPLSAVRTL